MDNLLEVLRIQRHDFLNQLQVISGLLQLKKYDQANEYIKQVAEKLGRAGVLARLGCPEIVAVVLVAEAAAGKKGITFNTVIGTGLEKGIDAGPAVAEIIREMLETAVRLTEETQCFQSSIDLAIQEKEGEYLFQVGFPCRDNADNLGLTASLVFIAEAASEVGGQLTTGTSAGGMTVISFTVPIQ